MHRLLVIAIVLVLPFSAALAKKKHVMLRLHAEANRADTAIFSTSVKAQLSGKEVSIEKVARITEDDVVGFYPYPLGNGQFGVLIQLDEHGRVSLDALSVERRGTFLFVFVNGRAITELQIDKRVTDGQLYIPSGLTSADIALMTKDWKVIGQKKKR